jgi:hypothetical protein
LLKQDPCRVKGSIELFHYINKLQTYKLKNVIQQSMSLDIKKKKRPGGAPPVMEEYLGNTKDEKNEEDK